MNFASGKNVLSKARREGYAIGAFNFQNMEILQAIANAANKERSPVLIQTSEGAIEYAGLDYLIAIARTALENSKVDIVLHLDHGQSFETAVKCIKAGYSSVMIDASKHDFEKNVRLTKRVADYAHRKHVSVEGELGRLQGVEDLFSVSERDAILTNPEVAKEFADRTGIDYLAVAIGTSHGPYKFRGRSKLDFNRLASIERLVKIPLVLHGASSVYGDSVAIARRYGARLEGAHGVNDNDLRKAIRLGVAKINTDTDLRIAFIGAARKALTDKGLIDIRKVMEPVRESVEEIVRRKIRVFGSGKS